MAGKRSGKKKGEQESTTEKSEPKFPYTTTVASLRKFLSLAPNKPKPPQVSLATLKTWGIKDNNASTVCRVCREIGLIDSSDRPTPEYESFMKKDMGAATLGRLVRNKYSLLFDHVTNPERASSDDLKNFFNIYSGGSERTIELQIATFKALAEHSKFNAVPHQPAANPPPAGAGRVDLGGDGNPPAGPSGTALHIDLHIHLPENKTKLDYDAIIESIATHLLKK
jgi:hypothetical protein